MRGDVRIAFRIQLPFDLIDPLIGARPGKFERTLDQALSIHPGYLNPHIRFGTNIGEPADTGIRLSQTRRAARDDCIRLRSCLRKVGAAKCCAAFE